MMHRGQRVDLTAIRNCGLMTVEGEKDDISGVGQTYAAQELCVNIPAAKKLHYLQTEVGHYGVFNGSRFRKEIAPRIRKFIATIEEKPAMRNGGRKSAAKRATVEAWRTERDARAPSFRQPMQRKGPGATADRLRLRSGGIARCHDWKVLYRDALDRDRSSRSIPSKEAALKQARDLYINERAELYSIEGPNGRTLPKEEIMRWVFANKWPRPSGRFFR